MLNATELGIAVLFVLSLFVISVLDIAFSSINRISFRRFLERPEIKSAPALASLLESRTEVLIVGSPSDSIAAGRRRRVSVCRV